MNQSKKDGARITTEDKVDVFSTSQDAEYDDDNFRLPRSPESLDDTESVCLGECANKIKLGLQVLN